MTGLVPVIPIRKGTALLAIEITGTSPVTTWRVNIRLARHFSVMTGLVPVIPIR
ncbi:hypothetical protein KBI52_14450 [Microvirga sp. HBU67558]|uniref:hypothetical protein n=1 Tax=Microvirga TaxID=186650 RepID=UPI001B38B01A|nr:MULTISPECIES: hypothetical protein [unclassified Microvirga]MBQ0821403.1 hypothetical protein [Microvirga sp. HBU67558]